MTTRDGGRKPKRTQVYDLAPISARLVALLLDWLLLGALAGVFMLVGRGWAGLSIGLLLGVGYHWYFLTQQRGQTPGKMVMNIRVIKADGSALTGADAALRCLGYYLNTALFMLGWLWALADANQQGLHDKLANTFVVLA